MASDITVFEKINEIYGRATYGGIEVLIMNKNGYINVTKMVALEGKEFSNWKQLQKSKDIISNLEDAWKVPVLFTVKGGKDAGVTGTYAHPDLVPIIILWSSFKFYYHIITIIKEWRAISGNEERFMKFIEDSRGSDGIKKDESKIRDRLAAELKGQTEVECEFGKIDLLTDDELIEIKVYRNWKHGVGQLIAYAIDYPDHQLRLHLFNIPEDHEIAKIRKVLALHKIVLTYEDDTEDDLAELEKEFADL